MNRDIFQIAKTNYLIGAIELEIGKHRKLLAEKAQELAKDPVYALRWFDAAFEAAGQLKLLVNLQRMLAVQSEEKKEWTLAELKEPIAEGEFRHATIVPNSTSACSNLSEQYYSKAMQEFLFRDRTARDIWCAAQWMDPEWLEASKARSEEQKRLRELEKAAEELRKREERKAKRAAAKAAGKDN